MLASQALVGVASFLVVSQGARVSKHQQLARSIAGVQIENYREDANDFMVVFKAGTSDDDLKQMCQGRCSLMGHPSKGGVAFATVHGRDKMEELVSEHASKVDLLEPDAVDYMIPELEGKVDMATASWGLERVGVPETSFTGRGVHMYVQDTGVRVSHTDFGGRAFPGMDMTQGYVWECGSDTSCSGDVQGHGTHCAGTASGTRYGVATQSLVYAVKTLSDQGSGARSWQLSGIDWVTAAGRRPAVLSMSLGGSGVDRAYTSAIGSATDAGVVVVVAAGNSNRDTCGFSPAFVDSAISVGATTSANRRASYSNFGRCNQIMAPGSAIVSAGVSGDSASTSLSGTSMACPHVSGGAALLLQQNPSWRTPQILSSMTSTGKTGFISRLRSGDPDLFLWVGA